MAAPFVYDSARDAILKQTMQIVTGTALELALVSIGSADATHYSVLTTHTNFSTVPGSQVNQSGSVLAGAYNNKTPFGTRTSTAGSLFVTGNSVAFVSVPAIGLAGGAIILWFDTLTWSTSTLVAYIDFTNWNPSNTVTPAGSTITFNFASTAPGILTI